MVEKQLIKQFILIAVSELYSPIWNIEIKLIAQQALNWG